MRPVVAAVLRAPFSRRPWREFAYSLASLLPAIPAFALSLFGLIAIALSLLAVGLPILALTLLAASAIVTWFRPPARRMIGLDWPSPPRAAARGPLRRLRGMIGDRAAWTALLYCFAKLPLTIVVVYVGGVAVVAGLAAVTAPAWWFLSHDGFGILSSDSWAATWPLAVQGVAVLLVFPWFVRVFVELDRVLITVLLGPNRDLERISALEASRATLTADAAATLRRIERDLHDGTQARLVSIGMMLSRLEHRVDDPTARDLVASCRLVVADGLDELREIIRGMHPPALDDGLPTALATLAARAPIATDLVDKLGTRPSDAAATTLYFSAAELLTNVAQHAEASHATLSLAETSIAIVLTVTDDGRGGAHPSLPGTGLAGLRQRAEALDGSLAVDSPRGGPTTVVVTLPKD